MKTTIRMLLGVLAAVAAWTDLRGADIPEAPKAGHVLLLANERTLEGDIERVGDQYRIKRLLGETWVPADKTLRLCADLNDAYTFLHGRANLDDADERLRLASWCHNHGLREEALAEVKAAVELSPNHKEAKRLLLCLQQTPATPANSTHAAPADSESTPTVQPVEVTAKSMSEFATHIQPILMNACANCHAGDKGGSFKLVRTFEHGSLAPKTTQQNLTAVLSQLNLEQPRSSPFLTKAVAVHGSLTQAPLSGRQMPAFHTMEEWVKLTLADRPATHEQPLQTALETPAKESKPFAPPKPEKVPVMKATAPAKTEEAPSSFSEDPTPKDKEPADPFDPVIFNRQMHPDKK